MAQSKNLVTQFLDNLVLRLFLRDSTIPVLLLVVESSVGVRIHTVNSSMAPIKIDLLQLLQLHPARV